MATHQTTIPIPLSLPRDEATALSELAKRVGYDDCVRLSSRFVFYTGRSECGVMWSAMHMLRTALAEVTRIAWNRARQPEGSNQSR